MKLSLAFEDSLTKQKQSGEEADLKSETKKEEEEDSKQKAMIFLNFILHPFVF